MSRSTNYITFSINDEHFALSLDAVERIIQVVEMRALPQKPSFLHGLANIYGELVPVINIHFLFGEEKRQLELSDQLVIMVISSVKVAILVDNTLDVLHIEEDEILKSDQFSYGKKLVKGVVKLDDGMLLINDADRFLDSKELEELESILKGERNKHK